MVLTVNNVGTAWFVMQKIFAISQESHTTKKTYLNIFAKKGAL